MGSVEVADRVGSVAQIRHGFPHPIRFGPTFPLHQVLQVLAFVAGIDDALDFVFLLSILCNIGGTRGSHRLTRKAFAIWLDTGDIYDGVDMHGAGKTEFDGISPNQLCDGIRTKPAFRQLP